ncbi:MAG TPA: sensor domain-containing diguanylate cyclase [Vicinamibacterales bacterium]|nr:sensor domain-containing diguanylate cyclase [Vicinamibacterales bacterium]
MALSEDKALTLETFKSLVEESITGVYLMQNERLVYVNRRLAEMFGYLRDELLGLSSVLELVAPSNRELVLEKLQQRLAGGAEAVEYSIRGVRKDGQHIDVDVRSVRTVYLGVPAVMGSMIDVTARNRMQEALGNLALVDDLTGVYNRRGFTTLAESHLLLARRRKRELLLIFADVDDLKIINDRYGHAAGDQVLVDAAAVLRKTYRTADIIARLGGDEFTAFPLEAETGAASALLARLGESVDRHNRENPRPYALSLSVGIGRFDPQRCQSIQQLLAEADVELYRRKRARPRNG